MDSLINKNDNSDEISSFTNRSNMSNANNHHQNNNNNNVNGNNNNNCNQNQNGHHQNNNNGNNVQQQPQTTDIRHTYSIAGIVQFLQYEWQRFELHRQQWEVEKSELQARIALLQGERKGQENLKNDLIRRIKMLEYCLKQERAKYHKLKHGVDPPDQLNDAANTNDELNDLNFELDDNVESLEQRNLNWKQGRQLLRHYLQEIGYTDTIIDIRSNRVRSLLGLTSLNEEVTSEKAVSKILQLSDCRNQVKRNKKDFGLKSSNNNNMMIDTESSVLATFEFLGPQNDHELDNIDAEDEDALDSDTDVLVHRQAGVHGHMGNDDAEEVMQEFDMMLNNPMVDRDWKSNVRKDVDLGELASLTETDNDLDNGNGSTCVPTSNNGTTGMRKTWNQKYILKSHYDCIRALRFHPTEALLITASEDETLKLWNLNKTQPSSKSKQQINAPNAIDLEPIYTYRGHSSRVLSLHVTNGNMFYSGAQDGEIISWSMPSNVMNLDPYDPFDLKLQLNTMAAHKDAVWALVSMTSTSAAENGHILCSASADRTIKIWNTSRSVCLKSFEHEDKTPTDLSALGSLSLNSSVGSSSLLLASFNDGSLSMYDIESTTTTPVLQFEMVPSSGSINAIAVHPTMPIVITAHQYRLIKLWDINTGKCIHSMVAHLDEVTSVDCDANGWYILSGSHDCSVRLWNFDSKNCVQEITSHRKKFDEAIFDVTFHPSKPYFASAGADGLAKVFV